MTKKNIYKIERRKRDKNYGSVEYYYSEIYQNMPTNGEKGIISHLIHKSVERPFDKKIFYKKEVKKFYNRTLEIGCGNGEHIKYLKNNNINFHERYFATDINMQNLLKMKEKWGGT
jgi:hypothetical protein